ncbi:sugar phosphate isomerase/epimerase and 4-hydroxyphenylpyruvate domain-containing protein [Salinibacterium sp. SYSU T00001]|uniref:bifunctional sugar phosphate isomerase/epimerase/4-hydroxyphenylpyruvate dioxygenase family protein n=1 Tax=Homoserinimonas sedimenticola TaxID=2986805 RepID=UPI0022365B49|nr:sugar phosphate isomerase/epimerase and 4-hydroxyphenylpyruvate domain-containing protein [Salinibacterium sedimenticola]MCW4385495.1 sugar phosphate isomerase/epimerase and 4-hydroxyphenylpyruvate domain-containing protein [Salinibacterium sedimenticola]
MRTSIATVCLSGTLEQKLAASADAGFDGVEIFEPDLIVSPHTPEQIRDLAHELGLTLDLYQPLRDMEGVTEDEFESNLRRAEAKFRLMNRLGIDTVLMCSNVATATIDDDLLVVDQLRRIGDRAAAHGVRVAYEALAWGRYVNDYEHVNWLVEAADHPQVGQCLDSFHILSRNWALEPLGRMRGEKIFFVQLADAPLLTLDVLSWSRHHRVFPGEGQFDLAAFMGQLVRTGYDGPVSLEIFNDTFRQSDPFRTAIDGMRSLTWLQDRATRWLASRPAPLVSHLELATLPTPAEPTGFNFVEVRSDVSHRLRDVLTQLGFEERGQHRSKPVELWQQGDARIIVNEVESAVGEPSVAALGFDVAEPPASVARALSLHASPVPRQQEEGEEELHGVRAPDSSEVFFSGVDTHGSPAWAGEFARGARSARADDLITGIDHVNLAQPWQHFDEAVLFYESVLGLHPQPTLEVAAPMGLVRSQAMRTQDGEVRLALNLAPIAGAMLEPAIHPQHVAFACKDIMALAEQASARGLEFLPIPQNYYDDLAARFPLEEAVLQDLQRLNLLYDRDEHGEFLHFYTEAVGQVFLEVVERRGGYEGYGAANTPVRLAAQHRRRDRAA